MKRRECKSQEMEQEQGNAMAQERAREMIWWFQRTSTEEVIETECGRKMVEMEMKQEGLCTHYPSYVSLSETLEFPLKAYVVSWYERARASADLG